MYFLNRFLRFTFKPISTFLGYSQGEKDVHIAVLAAMGKTKSDLAAIIGLKGECGNQMQRVSFPMEAEVPAV